MSSANEEMEFTLEEWEKLQPRRAENASGARSHEDEGEKAGQGEGWEHDENFPASLEDDTFSDVQRHEGNAAPERPRPQRQGHHDSGRGRKKRRPGPRGPSSESQ